MVAKLMELANLLFRYRGTEVAGGAAWDEAIALLLLMLAPAAPHVTEELWARRLAARGEAWRSIHAERWPAVDAAAAAVETREVPVQVNGKVRDRVEVAVGLSEAEVEALVLARPKVIAALARQRGAGSASSTPAGGRRGVTTSSSGAMTAAPRRQRRRVGDPGRHAQAGGTAAALDGGGAGTVRRDGPGGDGGRQPPARRPARTRSSALAPGADDLREPDPLAGLSCIPTFSERIWAPITATPSARAIATSWRSSSVPIPLPCHASVTSTANSASSVPNTRLESRPMPTIAGWPVSGSSRSATRAISRS